MTTLLFLQKSWVYIKKYWQLSLLLAGVVIGYFFFKKERTDFAEQLQKLQHIHDEEIKKITDAYNKIGRAHV